MRKFRGRAAVVGLLATVGIIYAVAASGAPSIPVPVPIVMVHTESGGVLRDTPVPIGGVPVPIDVDNGSLLGILSPDIDVAVNLISVPDLPNILVPNIVVRRNLLAVVRHTPAPPLNFYAQVAIEDAGNLKRLATIDYGYETPPGAKIPPIVTATLLGPIQSGFIDPLKARIDAPGYNGALKFNIRARTDSIDDKFQLKFDPLPSSINITEDPRDDGLDFTYDHTGPTPDVKLDAQADLKDVSSGRVKSIGAVIERLPNHMQASYTSTSTGTKLEYFSGSELGKPDLEASYRDTLSDGTIVTDGNVRISGLPSHIKANIATRPGSNGTTDIDGVDFSVVDGGQIDALDFVARNFLTNPGNVKEYNLGPEQFVAMASKRQADGTSRFRASGHLLAVRGGSFARTGDKHENLDVTTDLGNGNLPLRGIVDLDTRGAAAADDPKHAVVDASIDPLPNKINITYQPSSATQPTKIVYDFPTPPSVPVNADTSALIAKGASDSCGADRVICAKASVDNVPPHLEAKLPGEKGTDFSVSHTGAAAGPGRPNVSATVDVGPDPTSNPPAPRTWARAALAGVPKEVRGRLDTTTGELRAAEFHACVFDFTTGECPKDQNGNPIQGAIDKVDFLVRDQPTRTGLPPRPDTASQFVTLISRHKAPEPKHFEVKGHVDQVRNVVFHQLDLVPNDNATDGVLGALVEVGAPHSAANPVPFDVAVDSSDDALGAVPSGGGQAPVIGDDAKTVAVHVDDLPLHFSACVRSSKEGSPPDLGGQPEDKLLKDCETSKVSTAGGEPTVTPLSASYTATDAGGNPSPTRVEAHVTSTAPDAGDLDPVFDRPLPTVSNLDLTVDKVPGQLRVDVIPPVTPDPSADPEVKGRRLQVRYSASSRIDAITFGLQQRRTTTICGDPRPERKGLCLSGVLENLPASTPAAGSDDERPTTVSYNPDDTDGTIDIATAPPSDSSHKLSLESLNLSKVSPEDGATPLVLSGAIEGIPPHITGKLQSLPVDGGELPATATAAEQLASCSNDVDDNMDGKKDGADKKCKKSLARVNFDACPDDGACSGIDTIDFTAGNVLVGDPLPHVPAPAATPGLTCSGNAADGFKCPGFSFVQSGDFFRAQGLIHNFRSLEYSQVDGGIPSPVTRIGAGIGDGSPIRAYVDSDTGVGTKNLDAVVTNMPETLDLCLRDKAPLGRLKATGGDFCDSADPNDDHITDQGKAAFQAKVTGTRAALPEIDVRSFKLTKGGGTELLAGSVDIKDLGQRIDALVGSEGGTDLTVEGHDVGDAPGADPKDVAGRVTFNFRNFTDAVGLGEYPWVPLNPDAVDPANDPSNNAGNFIKLVKNYDGAVLASGSVPDIRRLQLSPKPCDTTNNNNLTPPASTFAPDPGPDYKCIGLSAAKGAPLGLAVRTLDGGPPGIDVVANQKVLSVDDGLITHMPDKLAITVSSPTDAEGSLGLCSETHTAPCRPPLLSLKNDPDGDNITQLQARMGLGQLADLKLLRDARPDDVLSRRLNYEAPPNSADYPNGARVKVGTNVATGNTAMQVGMKLNLPRYLDLDPLTQFSCTHDTENPNEATGCAATDAGSDFNHGYDSKNIDFRMVAADDDHFGNPTPSQQYLGRVAVMVEPLAASSQQGEIILTGMPDPDNLDPIKHVATQGASSKYDEDLPPEGDPSQNGFMAPAHLDARIFLRNDFNSSDENGNSTGRAQINYSQIDGRVNAPLSMAVRLNDRAPAINFPPPFPPYIQSANRDNQAVPTTQLTIRNAAGSNNSGNYSDPTFRIRAELRKGNKDPDTSDEFGSEVVKFFFKCKDGDGYGIGIPDVAKVCLVLPLNAKTRYLDIQANADPRSDGSSTTADAARTVDIVGGPFGGSNDVEIRGWKQVNSHAGPLGKGDPADVTTAGAVRLTNFRLGLQASAGVGFVGATVTLQMIGDLVLGLAGNQLDLTRIASHNTGVAVNAEARAGETGLEHSLRLMTDMVADQNLTVSVDVLFGLGSVDVFNTNLFSFHQGIQFNPCADNVVPGNSAGLDIGNQFWSGMDREGFPTEPGPGARKAAISLGLDSWAGLSQLPLILLSNLASPLGCSVFEADAHPLISEFNPAPGYRMDAHPVPDLGLTVSDAQVPAPPQPNATPLQDLPVPSTGKKLCGTYTVGTATIDGPVTVGAPGETDDNAQPCDGSLTIDAQDVRLNSSISADGIMSGGAGQPGSGSGGGAGHTGGGGAAGAPGSVPGAPTGSSTTNPILDFGSEGRAGDAAAGKGGGTIVITAAKSFISQNGSVTARGAGGTGATVDTGGACQTGGGGGSGGAVSIAANLIEGPGTISVDGGAGGDGGFGGGGGSGGRVTLTTVNSDITPTAALGAGGGVGTGFCDETAGQANPRAAGNPGAAGNDGLGLRPGLIANATLNAANPGPYSKTVPKIDLIAVAKETQQVAITLCRRKVSFATANPFGSSALDPNGNDTVDHLKQGATCQSPVIIKDPTTGTHTYAATIEASSSGTMENGVYGFFAYASQPTCGLDDNGNGGYQVGPDLDTEDPSDIICSKINPKGLTLTIPVTYLDQTLLPLKATAKIGVDLVAPPKPTLTTDGTPGCPASSLCLGQRIGHVTVTDEDDPTGSGIRTVGCHQEPANIVFRRDCRAKPSTVHLREGINTLTATTVDLAENRSEASDPVKWFVDTKPPAAPVIPPLTYSDGAGHNGWHTVSPEISLSSVDPAPSSGFPADSLTLFVDEASIACGTEAPGNGFDFSECSAAAIQQAAQSLPGDGVPGEGTHEISASATDRLGNTSARSEVQTSKVDTKAPTSDIFIGPKNPDGGGGWYRSHPFVAFAASDHPGGSGIDPSLDTDNPKVGTGIHLKIDNGPWELYKPEEEEYALEDGVHSVCWYAVDVAGNVEDHDPATESKPHCRTDIKVDTTAPSVTDPIAPAAPNGTNGFYITKPTITPGGSDPVPSAGVTISGIDKVQYQVDDGDWTSAAPVVVQEGEHEIRVRAFDKAGNAAPLHERTVRVDLTKPTAAMFGYPPAPNSQGWFRQSRVDVLTMRDSRNGSDIGSATFTLDGATSAYTAPFTVPPGPSHTASGTPRDRAGLAGPATPVQSSKIDVTAPVANPSPTAANTLTLLKNLLGALLPALNPTTLAYSVSDDLSSRVKVTVFVYDQFETLVKTIPVTGPYAGGYRDVGQGSVTWNGTNEAGKGVLPGVYHYRVSAVDMAGNTVSSTESLTFLVVLGLLPL